MEWFEAVDGYCERVDAAFWSEPINAITNAAFLIAAIWAWWRPNLTVMGRVLTIILALIGIGSFLFHTFAQPWAGVADVLPILLFILVYIYAATRDYFGASRGVSWLAVIGFFSLCCFDRGVDFRLGISGLNPRICACANPDPDLRLSVAT